MGGTANIRREAKASREQEQLAKTKAQEHKANEDAESIGFENPTLKREKKREEDAKREDEIALRKAENRRLAKMEEEEMNKLGQKKSSSSKKLTKFEIEQNKAMDAKARLKADLRRSEKRSRTSTWTKSKTQTKHASTQKIKKQ